MPACFATSDCDKPFFIRSSNIFLFFTSAPTFLFKTTFSSAYVYIISDVFVVVNYFLEEYMMTTFSENLKKLRSESDISQLVLAKEIGTTTRQIQRYESGENEPKLSQAVLLADYFDVSLDYLVGRTNEK
ncbi:helix-turn-helix transcriptional regulator [Enterococcus hirae]|uniref:helix-turn-helix domain-containing protein n=2 Tax=Enterococcus hirae TaxID=1354 RepID=UPI0030CA256C